jgi:hypothetical protein
MMKRFVRTCIRSSRMNKNRSAEQIASLKASTPRSPPASSSSSHLFPQMSSRCCVHLRDDGLIIVIIIINITIMMIMITPASDQRPVLQQPEQISRRVQSHSHRASGICISRTAAYDLSTHNTRCTLRFPRSERACSPTTAHISRFVSGCRQWFCRKFTEGTFRGDCD